MKWDLSLLFKKAVADLSSKSLREIQVETSLTWCARACAAAHLGLPRDATEYAHEAIEHAALSGNDVLLQEIRAHLEHFGVVL